MENRKRILLIGTGLIGGSAALAIRKEHDALIIGFDANREHCELAQKLNIIDECTENPDSEAERADLIILACPVDKAEKFISRLSGLRLKKSVIVTDVGSTKSRILKSAAVLKEKGTVFIGGHPMAGSHKGGPGSAKAHLFENAFYVLTPLPGTPDAKVEELKDWLKGTGANFIEMEAEEHDKVTGIVSHFPHLIAASLVRRVEAHAGENEKVKWLAAGGFRDITRIASSSPEMWKDIVLHNKEELSLLLDEWMDEMSYVKGLLEAGEAEVSGYFSGAKKFRDGLPVRAKGAITSFYDLYVDVLDKPGVISDVTTLLAKSGISLTNIRILEAREDVFGVLRLSFQTEEDRGRAKEKLEKQGYETYLSF